MTKIFVQIEVPDGPHCGYCQYLSIKEHQQLDTKMHHICNYFDERVKHLGKHPRLPKHPACLAAPVAMECGHHPSLFVKGFGKHNPDFCRACEESAPDEI